MSNNGPQPQKKPLVFRLNDHGQGPDLVRQVFLERGWVEYDEDEQSESGWNLWWRTSRFRMCDYENLFSWQRLNHYPKSTGITKKDCLVRHMKRMKGVHGSSMYNFSPLSFNLPNDYTRYVAEYGKLKAKTDSKHFAWICKPADMSRGRGIFVFRDISELQYDCNAVVQQYIANPLLIGGYKFDIRLYVAVPSFHPLTVYVFQEGIVRFSTEKYDLNALNNVFAHLTNTSINKHSPSYTTDKEKVGPGCKWTLTQLRYYFHQNSLDDRLLWTRMANIIILTLLIQAPQVPKEKNCYELYGFDILIDEKMKPWLLEVNFSPALGTDCQTDVIVKKPMLHDLIDMLNFKDVDAERGGVDKQAKAGRVTNRGRMSAGKNKPEPVDRNTSSSRLSQRGSLQRNGSTVSAMLKSIEGPDIEQTLSFIQQDNPSISKAVEEMCYGLPLVHPSDDEKNDDENNSGRSSAKSDVIEADIYALYTSRSGRFTPSITMHSSGYPNLEKSFGSFERSGTMSPFKKADSVQSLTQRGDKTSLKSFSNSDSAYSSFSDNSDKMTGNNTSGKSKIFSRGRKSYALQTEVLSETPRESAFQIKSLLPNENSRSLKRLSNRGVTPVNGMVSFRSKTKVSMPRVEKNLNKSRTFDRAPSRNVAPRSTSRFGNLTTRSEMDLSQKNRSQVVVSSMSNISKATPRDKETINLSLTGTSKKTTTGQKLRQRKPILLHSKPKGPPPKVGDFFLVFPFNEGTYRTAHSTLDPHVVIKETQKLIRDLKQEVDKNPENKKLGSLLPYGALPDSERLWGPVKPPPEETH